MASGAGAAVAGRGSLARPHRALAAAASGLPRLPRLPRPLPSLDGTLETAPEVLAELSGDFGRLVARSPAAVLRPGSVDDVARIVRYARRHDLRVAMNGQSGTARRPESHSNLGQALVPGGIAIDAGALSTIHRIDATSADVDAGVTWARLVAAAAATAAATGATPPMLTDFLHLSVGGTLSVGGIGGTMQAVGTQADNVDELEVVTGRGDVVTCTPHRNAGLFDAVLAGLGQCGLIVRTKVRLVAAETSVLVFNLFYDDLRTFLDDQLRVLHDRRFTYLEGQIVRRPDDSGWRYMLEVASYFTPPAAPDQAALLAGLSDDRASAAIDEVPYRDWAFRVDPLVEELEANGLWDQPHPWLSLWLPASQTAGFVGDVLVPQLTPDDLGLGLVLLYPVRVGLSGRPLFALPDEPVAFQLSLLRFPLPGADVPAMLAQNRELYDRAVALGGKRYAIGAIPAMSRDDWRRHFGPAWPALAAAKQRFDPDGILTPGQAIFPR